MELVVDIKNFISKFLGFYKAQNGEMWEYNDKLGYGTFEDGRHIWYLAIIVISTIMLYRFCKKDKEKGKKLVKGLMITMLVVRIILQIVKTIVGNSLPHGRDLIPGQMCTILIYLLPLTILFNWKKIDTPVYVLSMMGGIMTFMINDYFNSRFISFYAIEGMYAHAMLFIIPIAMMGLGEFKLEWKKIWQVIVMMLIMIAWATFLNKVVFKAYEANYFYLEKNKLPGNLGGKYFFGIYTIIFFVLLLLIYTVPIIFKKLTNVLIKENKKLEKKIVIITIVSIAIIAEILTIGAIKNRTTKFSEEEKKVNLAVLMTILSNKDAKYSKEEMQERLDSIVGENKTRVDKAIIGLNIKFLETSNVYNTINARGNIKAFVIKQKVSSILVYVLEGILVINLVIVIWLIVADKKAKLYKIS